MDLRFIIVLLTAVVWARPAGAACGALPPAPNTCSAVSDINCAACTTADGAKVPDPFDCHNYYYCNKDETLFMPVSFPCPDGQWFNPAAAAGKLACEAETTPCTNACAGGGGCEYSCGAGTTPGQVGDPYDCSTYYTCDGTTQGPATHCTPPDMYFDGSSCQPDASLCCHCKPYCYDAGFHPTADPTDCRKFFVCDAGAIGMPSVSGECSRGTVYDANLGACSASAPCNTQCTNVVGEDGCIDPYTCTAGGYFAACPQKCGPNYFHCDGPSDDYVEPIECKDGTLFNPDTLLCVKAEDCPYDPLTTPSPSPTT